jgi:hypothetical protein
MRIERLTWYTMLSHTESGDSYALPDQSCQQRPSERRVLRSASAVVVLLEVQLYRKKRSRSAMYWIRQKKDCLQRVAYCDRSTAAPGGGEGVLVAQLLVAIIRVNMCEVVDAQNLVDGWTSVRMILQDARSF